MKLSVNLALFFGSSAAILAATLSPISAQIMPLFVGSAAIGVATTSNSPVQAIASVYNITTSAGFLKSIASGNQDSHSFTIKTSSGDCSK
ncbi:hypothetical protein WJM97_07165 [Okeanomitos corallinicola TIOX110]|uniref:Uncharacterized protein n=1 Tax=Okeanomitos corallinicola TIOX110 TaxID=3133117 RepID=A0ABZ2UWH3_9CYAN